MLSRKLMIALLASSALCVGSCAVSRKVTSSVATSSRFLELRDSSVLSAIFETDSLVEVTTITVRENEAGDTLRVAQVTDRTRTVARDRAREVQERVVVRTDTVYVEKRDSVFVRAPDQVGGDGRKPPFVSALKWVFWILISLVVLVFTLKFWRI